MPEMSKTVQLAHLLSKGQGEGTNQEIILDALFNISGSVDYKALKVHIIELFGVDIPDNRIRVELTGLQKQGTISSTSTGEICLSDVTRTELSKQKAEDSTILDAAFTAWTSDKELFPEISVEEANALKVTMMSFLNRIFVSHGASCLKLLIQEVGTTDFDINGIASDVAERYGSYKEYLKGKLPTIFSMTKSIEVRRLLELVFGRAIKYLSSFVDAFATSSTIFIHYVSWELCRNICIIIFNGGHPQREATL